VRRPSADQGFHLKFYVYEHWRPDLDLPFYVGKGKGPRAFKFDRNKDHAKVQAKLAKRGMCVEVRLVRFDLTEQEAYDIEIERIAFWREAGIRLVNKTNGGGGFSGFIRPLGIRLSPEARAKLSAARKGMKFSAEHRANLSARKTGVPRPPFTEETRARMRAASAAREAAKRDRFGPDVKRTSRLKDPA